MGAGIWICGGSTPLWTKTSNVMTTEGSDRRSSRRPHGANALSKRTKTVLLPVGVSTGQESKSASRQDVGRGSSLCWVEGKADQVSCECFRKGTFLRDGRSHRERRRVCCCLLPHNRWVGRGP